MRKIVRVLAAAAVLSGAAACTAQGTLPGRPGYSHRLTAEVLAAGRADGPAAAADVLAESADRRLDEIAAAADPSAVTALVQAYVKTVREGIIVLLARVPETGGARRTAGERLLVRMTQQASRLQGMGRSMRPPLARLIRPALDAAEQAVRDIRPMTGPGAERL